MSPPLTRIDVHHHYFPALEISTLEKATGWSFPRDAHPWSPEVSIEAMDRLGIQKAILSSPNSAANAREVNLFASKIVKRYPERFGFFATLPLATESMDVVLEEMRYSLDELHADGISVVSSYGKGSDAKYLGHTYYESLWDALNKRNAIVFLHGDQTPSSNVGPSRLLPIPIVEVPNETYKAAADLVTSGTKRKYPRVKIILSHSGGSTPFLACRAAVLAHHVGTNIFGESLLSIDEMLQDFKSFYYETALSGYDANLATLQKFVEKDHILFGSDFPAVSVGMVQWFTDAVDRFFADDQSGLAAVMKGNYEAIYKDMKGGS
ncbi:hypothetical protein CBS101457_002948 [Exobasidium rhododendri]|nr:hypothetical protein CBS101457_002948 [Exobasidium rhododendri]